ncbi:flagellar hook-length control protein FliK [Ruegeria sp. AD91A]|uniref:flagellar hook-length control protein FliK n=1 Tax=Ruegeria sp. AD91A TaxID=2293862 RepID=UPI000E483BB4|nr:flagellar hook-length control protein FliK [Ruegeria sp. AD91A]AXT28061.1 flagellar hook-length control protein FliK [Ruegeria sp. AD91A]
MPNPLTLANATPTSTEKAATSRKAPGQNTGPECFQDVLGQEVGATGLPEGENSAINSELTNVEAEPEPVPGTTAEASAAAHPSPISEHTGEQQIRSAFLETPGLDEITMVPVQIAEANQTPSKIPDQPQVLVSKGLSLQSDSSFPVPPLSQKAEDPTPQPAQMTNMTEKGQVFDQLVKTKGTVEQMGGIPRPLDPEKKLLPEVNILTPKPPTPNRAPSVAQLQLMATAVEFEPVAPVVEAEALHAAREEPLPLTSRDSVPQLTSPSSAARAEIARAMAGQLAAAVQTRTGSGATEIALNPEELGRVSIVLNGREDGLQITIATERPETLELMRRHLSVLTEEFQKLGYGDLSFDLGTSWGSGAHQKGADDPDTQSPSRSEAAPHERIDRTTSHPQNLASGRGIDMRF